jgi:hypothetical protein
VAAADAPTRLAEIMSDAAAWLHESYA